MRKRYVLWAIGLWGLAALQSLWIVHWLLRLPADYSDESSFASTLRSRDRIGDPWTSGNLIGRRVEQTLTVTAGHSILQGDLHWTDPTGDVAFETTNVYGVDRATRANVPNLGNVARTGGYLFPLHVQRRSYRIWDPQYVGPRTATFGGTATIGGLEVYVFPFVASGLDESSGFAHLPDVPERYRALTDGRGTMWVEPTSGIVVDYQEQGSSYFADRATLRRVAPFFHWTDRYTPATKAAKLRQATAARRRIHLLERWLPGALVLAGVICLALGWRRRAMPAPDFAGAPEPAP